MKISQLLHTPEGVRDMYGQECARKRTVEERILRVFQTHGYQMIETPTFEFFDIFSKDRGSVASREMFKLFDRENNTLVLRPDMTPAIARCVAKYDMEETMPLHLCYLGQTFTNTTSYRGRLKEMTQTGAECVLDASADADAQVIAMVIEALRAAGLTDFQVEMGQVEFFRGLIEEAGMDEETTETLRELIERKNYFGVEEVIAGWKMKPALKELFLKLPDLFGSIEIIEYARKRTSNVRAQKALNRLEEVYHILELYGLTEFVSLDLGMLNKYQYYTGIIFKAYTYGTGDYLVNGGRYDKLLVQFGKEASAVGFAILVDSLMSALERQKIEVCVPSRYAIVLYHEEEREHALSLAVSLRKEGHTVMTVCFEEGRTLLEYKEYASRMSFEKLYYWEAGMQQAEEINLKIQNTGWKKENTM